MIVLNVAIASVFMAKQNGYVLRRFDWIPDIPSLLKKFKYR
jgi:hypothetical protein